MKHVDIMDYVSRLARFVRRGGMGGQKLPRSAYMVLRVLENLERIQMSELAEKLDIRASSLSEIVSKMTHHELIEREKDEADSRIAYVSMTEKGRGLLKQNDEVYSALQDELNEVLTTEEQEQFALISEKLIAYFETKQTDRRHGHGHHGFGRGHGHGHRGGED